MLLEKELVVILMHPTTEMMNSTGHILSIAPENVTNGGAWCSMPSGEQKFMTNDDLIRNWLYEPDEPAAEPTKEVEWP